MTDETNDTDDAEQSTEPDERIERTDVGASVEVSITRGTGTRDQEKWKLKGKGETAEAAVEELKYELGAVIGAELGDGPLADQVRNFQPEANSVEEADD